MFEVLVPTPTGDIRQVTTLAVTIAEESGEHFDLTVAYGPGPVVRCGFDQEDAATRFWLKCRLEGMQPPQPTWLVFLQAAE